jgi:hypothetical protein
MVELANALFYPWWWDCGLNLDKRKMFSIFQYCGIIIG